MMVLRLISDADETRLGLRARRDDLLDCGTREQEDVDGLLPLVRRLPLWALGSHSGTLSSLLSDREGALGTGWERAWPRLGRCGSDASAGARSSRWCLLRRWWRCLEVLQRSPSPWPASLFAASGSGTWFEHARDLHSLRVVELWPSWQAPTAEGWHSGLRALTSPSAVWKDSSVLPLPWSSAGRWRCWC